VFCVKKSATSVKHLVSRSPEHLEKRDRDLLGTMKLLCLHGYGTNGEVLRAQMQPILLALGGQQELVMLEGDIKVYASGTSPIPRT
jgi:hypothetical protein